MKFDKFSSVHQGEVIGKAIFNAIFNSGALIVDGHHLCYPSLCEYFPWDGDDERPVVEIEWESPATPQEHMKFYDNPVNNNGVIDHHFTAQFTQRDLESSEITDDGSVILINQKGNVHITILKTERVDKP